MTLSGEDLRHFQPGGDTRIINASDLGGQRVTWTYRGFRKWWYPQIIHFNRNFHYKSSILGYPYSWKHPHITYMSELELRYHTCLTPQSCHMLSRKTHDCVSRQKRADHWESWPASRCTYQNHQSWTRFFCNLELILSHRVFCRNSQHWEQLKNFVDETIQLVCSQ